MDSHNGHGHDDSSINNDIGAIINVTALLSLRSIVMSVSVCLSVRDDTSRTTRAIFTNFCACCLCPWLGASPDVDDRPHRLSAGRGDGSAQRGRSVIYGCLVITVSTSSSSSSSTSSSTSSSSSSIVEEKQSRLDNRSYKYCDQEVYDN